MKLALDISHMTRVFKGQRTGIERVVEHLFTGIVNSDIDTTVSFLSTEYIKKDFTHYLKEHNIKHHFKDANDTLHYALANYEKWAVKNIGTSNFFSRKSVAVLRKLMERMQQNNQAQLIKSDIFHSTFYGFPQFITEAKKIKKVITIYDMIPLVKPEFFESNVETYFKKMYKNLPQDIYATCISENTRQDFCNFTGIPQQRTIVIPLAAETSIFYKCTSPEKKLAVNEKYKIPNQKYFLSVCTFEPRKNIPTVIRSFLKLLAEQKMQDVNLVLVGGKGWMFDSIFEQIEVQKKLKDKIIVTGYVHDADIATIYSNAVGFVYPSLYEGFGLPPLEAMQCGTPVIVSNTSSLPEVVGNAGILINPTNETDIASAMYSLYSNHSLQQELSKLSIEKSKEFSWPKFVNTHLSFYQNII